MDKLARYFPTVENSKSFSRKKLCQNKIGTFHLKHPVYVYKKISIIERIRSISLEIIIQMFLRA